MVYRAVNAAAEALGTRCTPGRPRSTWRSPWGRTCSAPTAARCGWADTLGLSTVAGRLGELAAAFGRRFDPHPELARRAAAGEPFHDNHPAPEPDRSRVAA